MTLIKQTLVGEMEVYGGCGGQHHAGKKELKPDYSLERPSTAISALIKLFNHILSHYLLALSS